MNIVMTLEMAATAGERPAVGLGERSLSAAELLRLARRAAERFRGASAVLYRAPNHLAYPVALFGCALAGVPFVLSTTASDRISWRRSRGGIRTPCGSDRTISKD